MVTIGETRLLKVSIATKRKLDVLAKKRGIEGFGGWCLVAREILDNAVSAEGAQ